MKPEFEEVWRQATGIAAWAEQAHGKLPRKEFGRDIPLDERLGKSPLEICLLRLGMLENDQIDHAAGIVSGLVVLLLSSRDPNKNNARVILPRLMDGYRAGMDAARLARKILSS